MSGRTGGKLICLPTLRRGGIKKLKLQGKQLLIHPIKQQGKQLLIYTIRQQGKQLLKYSVLSCSRQMILCTINCELKWSLDKPYCFCLSGCILPLPTGQAMVFALRYADNLTTHAITYISMLPTGKF